MKFYLVKENESVIDEHNPFFGTEIERFYGKTEKVVKIFVKKSCGEYVDHIGNFYLTTYGIRTYGFARIQDAKTFITKHKRSASENLITYEIIEIDI